MANLKKVLFVDDDPSFLELLSPILEHYSEGQWKVFTAVSASQGLAILQENQVELMGIDLHMPVVDGMQFLSLLQRKYPGIIKVILTGYASDEYRAACLSNGAELFLEKPSTPEGWKSIYEALSELIKLKPDSGFHGVLRQVGLQDVLQLSCLARHSVILQITAGNLHGEIFVRDGEILHAQCGERAGENAFNFLLGLKGGEFSLKPFAEPPSRTIDQQWEFLLMEAARTLDEAGQAPLTDSQTEFLLRQLAETGKAAESPALMAEEPAPEPPPQLEPTPLPVPGLFYPPSQQPERETKIQPTAKPPAELQPRIDELLVCSVDGDVLHEWQCPNADARVNFLEFLCQKAGLLQRTLPIGEFERFEVNGAQARVVAQLQPERALFLRSSRVSAVPVGK